MNLALFDFDGTITTKDSLEEFIIFAKGASRYYAGLLYLSPMLLLYKLHIIPNGRAKELFLAHFFKGTSQKEFETLGEHYALNEIDKIVRPQAKKAILQHQQNGDTVVIVSASVDLWLKVWCQKSNIALISTELEFKNGMFTGRFKGENIYAYGDSEGDRELLALANKSFYKPFRQK